MAGFNISGFRANGIREGGARPSLFTVSIKFPPIVNLQNAENRLQFLCRGADIPDSVINKIDVPYFGRVIKVAGDREFGPWNVRIINDEDFVIRNAFEAWHNAMNTIISNRLDERVSSIDPTPGNSYKTVASVTQFKKTGPGETDGYGAIKTYEFDGIFPTQISPIRLDWENRNAIEEFDVVFEYDWWVPSEKANDQPIFPVELNPA
jgi:hypothetical protein